MNDIRTWIIVGLMGVILLMRMCSKPCPECPKYIVGTTVQSDTIWRDTGTHRINWYPKPSKTIHDTTWQNEPVDTLAIMDAYSATNIYYKEYADTNLSASFADTIWRNQFAGRSFSYALKSPRVIIHNTTTVTPAPKLRNKIFVGGSVGMNQQFQFDVGPQILLNTKRDKMYSLGYDVRSGSVMIGTYFKIKLHK